MRLTILLAALSVSTAVVAQPTARAYVCTFDVTASATIDAERGGPTYRIQSDALNVTFAAVDLDGHKAQIIGNGGAAGLVSAPSALAAKPRVQ